MKRLIAVFLLMALVTMGLPALATVEAAAEEDNLTLRMDEILALFEEPMYDTTYKHLSAGKTIAKGEKSKYAKGLQTLLVALGSDISIDGQFSSKSVTALNAAYAALGMKKSGKADAAAFERLLMCLACVKHEDDAYDILIDSGMTYDEVVYLRACGLELAGMNYIAYRTFCITEWDDAYERADHCILAWPKNGEVYRNPSYTGKKTQLTIKVDEQTDGYASLFKIYAKNGDLVSCLFVGGAGKATVKLPGSTYTIKAGVGDTWFGVADAFGFEGNYETMLFDDGSSQVTLKGGYEYTITISAAVSDPTADDVGSEYESYEDF